MKFITMLFVALIMAAAPLFSMTHSASAAPLSAPLASPDAGLVVNDVGDDGDATPGDGECATAGALCTLRAALQEANALQGAEVITFNLPPASNISASSDELLITDSVTIEGPGAENLNLNTGFAFHRVLRVAAGDEAIIHISGLIIAGGILPVGHGAGIFLEGGTLYLDAMMLQNNMAQNESGGAIAVSNATLYLTGSGLYSNSASTKQRK